jgi:co-chaperonin GroES (HSP10)
MSLTVNPLKATLTPIRKNVIVSDMYFGEQKTKGGLIIKDDDGTTRGIYPRWARVHAKGPENTEEYSVGDWVLIDHGRWTRSVVIDEGSGEKELRMIDVDAILIWSNTKPDDVFIGNEYANGSAATVNV